MLCMKALLVHAWYSPAHVCRRTDARLRLRACAYARASCCAPRAGAGGWRGQVGPARTAAA
eukprot:11204084-Lingulodinium_polyedra.AAC.1